jgi:hypothetical protein
MFTSWFEANKKFPDAKSLTYGQFVSKFVYVKKTKTWKPRKRGYTIGRLVWVPQTAGEIYYLRMMLTVVKGPKTYDSIKIINGFKHETFREACYAMGFLEDDREFISAIKEAHEWGSGTFLRKLFVMMLLSGSMNRPDHVWNKTKKWLCDGILYKQRMIARNKGILLSKIFTIQLYTSFSVDHLSFVIDVDYMFYPYIYYYSQLCDSHKHK